jgi:putative molybdopterin biosynthesis protein
MHFSSNAQRAWILREGFRRQNMRYIAYMLLTPALTWTLDGVAIDARLLRLLAAIAELGSLQRATAHAGVSYRHAWDLLGRLETALGTKLVELERGRGARLTAFGAALTEKTAAIARQLEPELRRSAVELDGRVAAHTAPRVPTLSIAASHDLALTMLAEMLGQSDDAGVELHVQGSTEALESLARKRCDLAGFHVPELPGQRKLVEPYAPWLKTRTLRLIYFADRRQGLIVAAGNPLGIESLPDLARTGARFVNRQPGSGTRLFLDALMSVHGMRPSQLNGYRTEEFTHAAVAAMIASGAADAAFGIEAAAAQHGLAFIPLASERYFLAARLATWARPGAQALLEMLSSAAFHNAVRKLPGYLLPSKVEAMTVEHALRSEPGEAYAVQSAEPRTPPRDRRK